MELEIYEPELLEDGRYEGAIIQVEEKEGKYGKYVELYFDIKAPFFPSAIFSIGKKGRLATSSDLYKLIGQFRKIEKGDKIDPAKELTGKAVSFLLQRVQSETNPDKQFLNVVKTSIKKLEPKSKTNEPAQNSAGSPTLNGDLTSKEVALPERVSGVSRGSTPPSPQHTFYRSKSMEAIKEFDKRERHVPFSMQKRIGE